MTISRRDIILIGSAALACGCAAQSKSEKTKQPIGQWENATSLPLALQEIYPTHHNGRIHQAGGFTATKGRISGPTERHMSWQPGGNNWREEKPLPIARHHPQLISFKGHLLAIAGFESHAQQSAWIMQKSGWGLYEENDWLDLAELPAPSGEAVLGITGDGILHLAGGRTPAGESNAGWQDHSDTDHHFILDAIESTWRKAAPCLSKRNSAAGDVINGALHIVGGRQVGGSNVTTHEVYDNQEDRWRTAAPMPQAQGGLAAAALNGKLYAFGGEYFGNGGGVYPESWVYDPQIDSWTALTDMLTPRHGLGAVTFGADIYVIGGAKEASGVNTSNIVERFTP